MGRKHLLVLCVVVSFLMIGCATTQPQVQVTEEPVYVEKPKKMDINIVISQLSQQISSTMLEQNKRRVAVMNFPLLTGEMTELGLYLSDKLTNSLFQYRDKFEVVERTSLESVLKEMKLGLTGMIDDKTAQSIGKVLGADAIVIGTITDLGEEVDINVRMIGTERANVLAVASSLLQKNDAIGRLMRNARMAESGKGFTGMAKIVKKDSDVKEKIEKQISKRFSSFQNSFVRVTLVSISKSKDKKRVNLVLTLENISKEDILIAIGRSNQGIFATLIDDKGKSWHIRKRNLSGIANIWHGGGGIDRKKNYSIFNPSVKNTIVMVFELKEGSDGMTFSFSADLFRYVNEGATRFSIGLSDMSLSQ